ncbi:hypothetical protein ACF0H5_020374 [Mactra antiquata]
MSSGFNLSTRKEDMSVRLKAQNLKRAKHETKKLEEEGKKMEERLMELKFAMNREKEERERQGGGFWKSGQHGTLNNYAEEVLAKKKSKSGSSKNKVKILKDKPLDLPERSNQPGTVAYIAQRGSLTPRDKPKGPKCGQCEERSAAVSCVQCSEDYCPGCFAAFHLKGNLKKHRSVPLTATPRQCFASPRPSQTNGSYDYMSGDGAVELSHAESARKKDRNSPEGASGTYENNLLHGSYNEAEQAASFQEALQAWRTGKSDIPESNQSGDHARSRPSTDRTNKRRAVPYSPVQTPTVNVDSSTGTADTNQDIEIKFNTSSMSYAERLLLKKHRRTDVDTLFTPRDGDISAAPTPRHTSGNITPRSYHGRPTSNMSLKIEDFNDGDFDTEERIDFGSLLDVVKMTDGENVKPLDADTVSIVEVQDLANEKNVEQTVKYKIKEEGELESWSTDLQNHPTSSSKFDVRPPNTGKSSRKKSGRKSARSSIDNTTKTSREKSSVDNSDKVSNNSMEKDSLVLGARLNDIENEVKREKISGQSRKAMKEKSNLAQEKSNILSKNVGKNDDTSDVKTMSKPPTDSSQSKTKNVKSRPQTGSRAQSRQGNQSRAQSRQGNQSKATSRPGSTRPSSRTGSRMSSRASSRIENPGLLTKTPSDALKEIARMTPTQDTYKGIDSFFMVGVQPDPNEERTLTPSGLRTNKDEKIKVSYQLYNMAPRSWKPDYSIMDNVDINDVEGDEAEDDRASSVMAYHAYSEQVMTDITERLISRFNELPLDEDSMSDRSSGGAYRSLGEEYRTFTPSQSIGSSVQNSPSMSGQATPTQYMKSQAKESAPTPRNQPAVQPSQTPRPPSSSKSNIRTPRSSRSRCGINTARSSNTLQTQPDRPLSRAIVMEGTDLSIFDNIGIKDNRDEDDEEALDQLEWELASQSGRVTADGKISRMEMPENLSDDSLNNSMESIRSMSRLGQDQGYDINSKLRKDELEDDESVTDDENDVRNLS